jgi:hypothetical protein
MADFLLRLRGWLRWGHWGSWSGKHLCSTSAPEAGTRKVGLLAVDASLVPGARLILPGTPLKRHSMDQKLELFAGFGYAEGVCGM